MPDQDRQNTDDAGESTPGAASTGDRQADGHGTRPGADEPPTPPPPDATTTASGTDTREQDAERPKAAPIDTDAGGADAPDAGDAKRAPEKVQSAAMDTHGPEQGAGADGVAGKDAPHLSGVARIRPRADAGADMPSPLPAEGDDEKAATSGTEDDAHAHDGDATSAPESTPSAHRTPAREESHPGAQARNRLLLTRRVPDQDTARKTTPPPTADDVPPGSGQRRTSGWLGPIIGGVIAALIGFGISHFDLLQLGTDTDLAPLGERVSALDAAVTALRTEGDKAAATAQEALAQAERAAQTAGAGTAPPDVADEVAALSARLDAVDAALAGIGPPGDTGDADARTDDGAASLPTALAAIRARLATLEADAMTPDDTTALITSAFDAREADLQASLRAGAEALARQTALFTLETRVEEGAPYRDLLPVLFPDGAAPAALAQHADDGLPSKEDLAAAFPDAAREALDASRRASAGDGLGDRLWTYVKIQTGARSLAPRPGDDPDAVLSRIEAAVQGDDLPAALAEIDHLPPEGRAAMAAWADDVQSLVAGRAAIADLSAATAREQE